MSSAGQANEAGSVARRNAAVYFGVYMLAGAAVEGLENFQPIVQVEFETPDPTDDIALRFGDGSRAFASSKRRVTKGPSFAETVSGWVDQIDLPLGDNDLLVLVCEESAGWVRDLADALGRLRAGAAVESKKHTDALAYLDSHVPPAKRDELRRRARILELPRTATSNEGRVLLALMMDTLVEDNAGASAVSAITARAHEWAGRALAFDTEKLVAMLADDGITVRADQNGPASARAAAARNAVNEYLHTLSAANGLIDLTLLAQDLKPVEVNDLLSNVTVSGAGTLQIAVRRHRRLLLVGQPGSGKSLALREVAGWTATEPHAPVPVPVHLPDLLPRHVDDVITANDLVALAAKRGPKDGVRQVEDFLRAAIEEGDAILLLDGLDECKDRAAWMAERLRLMVEDLHPLCGVIIGTRASAELPAQRIGLPRFDLARPADLDATMDAILVQCAEVRILGIENRREWLRVRRAWLADARVDQAEILHVPQLALLVALIISSTADLEIPKRRAELLHEAVRESVQRWEHDKFNSAWATDLTPQVLIDGFVSLGRLLEDRVHSPSRAEALAVISDILVDPNLWSLSGAKARELAAEVLRFWDSHVGVFVLDEEDRLTSRSKVFTEIAAAMWTTMCSPSVLRQWATEAVRFYDRDGVVALALGLNPDLTVAMLDLGGSMVEATQAVAAAAAAGAIEMSHEQTDTLITQLGSHAAEVENGTTAVPERESRGEPSPFDNWIAERYQCVPSWPLVDALCRLGLSQQQRQRRRDVLAGIALDAPHRQTVGAWLALADAEAEGRPLSDDEFGIVAAVLARELPVIEPMVKVDGVATFTSGGFADPGLSEVAYRALDFLDQLPETAPEQIYRISEFSSHGDSENLRHALSQAGVDIARWEEPSPMMNYFISRRERQYEVKLLEDIADIGDSTARVPKHNRWSLEQLADLIRATGYPKVSVRDFPPAFDVDDAGVRRPWLRALGRAYGIDLALSATQAASVLQEPREEFATPPSWSLITYSRSEERARPDPARLDAADQRALLRGMHATSHWIAHASLLVLARAEPTWDTLEFFEADRSDWPPYRASECYLLALLVSPAAARLTEAASTSPQSAQRHALARAISFRHALDPTGEYAAQLAGDDDLWVRGDRPSSAQPAAYWTCRWCGRRNDYGHDSCSKCELASRPIAKREEIASHAPADS